MQSLGLLVSGYRDRSSNNCSSYGLLRPLLILQNVPSVQDCLEEFNNVLVLSKVSKLGPHILISLTFSGDNMTLFVLLPFDNIPQLLFWHTTPQWLRPSKFPHFYYGMPCLG